jgi:hypothetical protein
MQIERILAVIRFLSIGPETVATLNPKLRSLGYDCSDRTIYRDLTKISEVLNTSQIHVAASEGNFRKRTWMIVSHEQETSISYQDYISLFLIEHFKTKWLKKVTGDTLKQIIDVNKGLSIDDFTEIAQLVPSNSVENSNWSEFIYKSKHKKFLQLILKAITKRIVLKIKWFSHEQLVEFNFESLRLVYHRGTVHLLGCHYKNSNKSIHVIELESIESIEELDKNFNMKGNQKLLDDNLQTKFGIHQTNDEKIYKVVLHLSKSTGIYISNRFWHKTQKFKLLSDGSYHMEMQCKINIELVGWIMSWLEHMKVVSPAVLKDHIVERVQYINNIYINNLDPVSPNDTNNWKIIGE